MLALDYFCRENDLGTALLDNLGADPRPETLFPRDVAKMFHDAGIRSRVIQTVQAEPRSGADLARALRNTLQQDQLAADAISELHQEMRSDISQERIVELIAASIDWERPQRREILTLLLREAIERDFEIFYSFYKILAETNVMEVLLKSKEADAGDKRRVVLKAEEHRFSLDFDEDLFDAARAVIQEDPERESNFEAFIRRKRAEEREEGCDEKGNFPPTLDLAAASLGKTFPSILAYRDAIAAYDGADASHSKNRFEEISKAFETLAKELFGEEAVPFYINKIKDSFGSISARMMEKYPEAQFIFTPFEYSPMLDKIPGGISMMDQIPVGKRHIADVDLENPTEENIIEAMFAKAEDLNPDSEPIILVVSSEVRMGAMRFDMDKISAAIAEKNSREGRKKFQLWVDGAHDTRIIRGADIVWYRKRFGAGMVVMDEETFPTDDGKDIMEAARLRDTYLVPDIALLIATLHAIESKKGHKAADLLKIPTLCHYRKQGGFLQRQIKQAQAYIAQSEVLEELFEIQTPQARKPGEWNIDAILRLTPTEQCRREFNLSELEAELQQAFVEVKAYNLEQYTGSEPARVTGFERLKEQVADLSVSNLQAFVGQVDAFQEHYKDWLMTVTLLPPGDKTDPDEVKAYFLKAARLHEFMRLYVTAVQEPGFLVDFLKRLELIIGNIRGRRTL